MARPTRRAQPTRPVRAVIYCRVSTEEQGDSGLGLEAQEATCRRWADFKEVEVVAVTSDVCSGARPPADRPGFAAALGLLAAGEADALVCAKLDRATRRQRVSAYTFICRSGYGLTCRSARVSCSVGSS